MTFGRLIRSVRQNRYVAAIAWRVAAVLHAASSWGIRLAQKARRNGGMVSYAGVTAVFPTDVGVEILSNVHWRGFEGYEPEAWRVLRELIPRSRCFIDVGSHIGLYSVLASRTNPALTIFAFEPVPEIFADANKFFLANGVAAGGLNQVALSDTEGETDLFLPVDFPTMGSIAGSPPSLLSRRIRVSRTRMDTFFAHRPICGPVTIKIDVENHERAVLAGARQTIAKHRPIMVCELLPRPHNAETIQLIHELNYAAFAITSDGCFRMGANDFAGDRSFRDFMLVPNERIAPTQYFVPFERLGQTLGIPVLR